MTVHHRKLTYAAAFSALAGAVAGFALGLLPLSWAVAVSLAALPGLGIVQLWGHPTEPQPHEQPIGASMPWTSPAVKGSLWAVVVVAIAAAGSTAHAIDADAVFSHYRTLALGDSVPAVVETLKARPTDVKIVQERPTLIQQLTWRRQRYVSGESAVVDPVDEMVLTFHLGQLTRIAVSYERNRTEGLTDADLTDAFVDVYGPPMLPSTSSHTTRVKSAPGAALGLWSDGVTLVTLRREGHPPQLKLTVATLVADAAMQEALADGAELAASEAPGKALAKSTADAAELLARADLDPARQQGVVQAVAGQRAGRRTTRGPRPGTRPDVPPATARSCGRAAPGLTEAAPRRARARGRVRPARRAE